MKKNRLKELKFGFLFSVTGILLCACSNGGGGGGGPSASGPAAKSLSIPPAKYTNGKCLNIAGVMDRLRNLPDGARLRLTTENFALDSDSANQHVRGNFSTVTAFSHFKFNEIDAADAGKNFPKSTQTGCESFTSVSNLEGTQTSQARIAGSPQQIQIDRDNGDSIVYELKSDRELIIVTNATLMDFCPDYNLAKTKMIQHLTWGMPDELEKNNIKISRTYLTKITESVNGVPAALMALALQSTDEIVSAPPPLLRDLKFATLAPDLQTCPYKAVPPAGDEPNAPVPSPSPSPSPSPAPSPTPDPSATPQPIPRPTLP